MSKPRSIEVVLRNLRHTEQWINNIQERREKTMKQILSLDREAEQAAVQMHQYIAELKPALLATAAKYKVELP